MGNVDESTPKGYPLIELVDILSYISVRWYIDAVHGIWDKHTIP